VKKLPTEFEAFWAVYPRHRAKLEAARAFTAARRLASLAEILAGVTRYQQMKPDYADWCYPATWLRQGRWMDEPDAAPGAVWRCPHDPPCVNTTWCQVVRAKERGEV